MNQLTLGERLCATCRHPEDEHPNRFLCAVADCRCSGFILDRTTRTI